MKRLIAPSLLLGLVVSAVPPALAQRCTREWNPVFREFVTQCDDGTTIRERHNPVFDRDDIEIQRPSRPRGPSLWPPTQRCTRTWDRVFQVERLVCE